MTAETGATAVAAAGSEQAAPARRRSPVIAGTDDSGRVVLNLSFSRLDQYEKCPFKFKAIHIDKMPRDESISLQMGQYLHEVVEAYCIARIETETEHEAPDRALLLKISNEILNQDRFSLLRSSDAEFRMVEEWINTMDLEIGDEILGVEVGFEHTLERPGVTVNLTGKIDKVVRKKGELLVSDYKTGRWEKKESDLPEDLQLKIYAYAVAKRYCVDSAKMQLYYVRTGNRPTVEIRTTPEWMSALEDEICARALEIARDTAFAGKQSALCKVCDTAVKRLCKQRSAPIPKGFIRR